MRNRPSQSLLDPDDTESQSLGKIGHSLIHVLSFHEWGTYWLIFYRFQPGYSSKPKGLSRKVNLRTGTPNAAGPVGTIILATV